MIMNYSLVVFATILSSAITLLITAVINYFKEKHISKLEINKIVFST